MHKIVTIECYNAFETAAEIKEIMYDYADSVKVSYKPECHLVTMVCKYVSGSRISEMVDDLNQVVDFDNQEVYVKALTA